MPTLSEAALERGRSEGIGLVYAKLGGQVRYRRANLHQPAIFDRKHKVLDQP